LHSEQIEKMGKVITDIGVKIELSFAYVQRGQGGVLLRETKIY